MAKETVVAGQVSLNKASKAIVEEIGREKLLTILFRMHTALVTEKANFLCSAAVVAVPFEDGTYVENLVQSFIDLNKPADALTHGADIVRGPWYTGTGHVDRNKRLNWIFSMVDILTKMEG